MKKLKPENWPLIIERLNKRGFTQQDIERLTGVDQRTISALKTGKNSDTLHKKGKAIMRLYKDGK